MNTARVPSNPAPTNAPSLDEQIRFRAYELFLKRGATHGRALEDWLQAEAELLRSKIALAPPKATAAAAAANKGGTRGRRTRP